MFDNSPVKKRGEESGVPQLPQAVTVQGGKGKPGVFEAKQAEDRLKADPAWNDGGFPNLVFAEPNGKHLRQYDNGDEDAGDSDE